MDAEMATLSEEEKTVIRFAATALRCWGPPPHPRKSMAADDLDRLLKDAEQSEKLPEFCDE